MLFAINKALQFFTVTGACLPVSALVNISGFIGQAGRLSLAAPGRTAPGYALPWGAPGDSNLPAPAPLLQ